MRLTTNRRRAILAAHGGVCHYCGSADATHVDHIVPRSESGSDDLGNLIAACLPCNLRKLRHRLPADAEQTALAAAERMREMVLSLERSVTATTVTAGITPAQCRAARGLLNWTQQQLADAAEVGIVTVRQFEAGRTSRPQRSVLAAIERAFAGAGVEFLPANGIREREPEPVAA